MSTTLKPVITQAGITALIDAKNRGVQARITHIAVGDAAVGGEAGPYVATETMTALKHEIQRSAVEGGELLGGQQNQLHLTATIGDQGENVPEVYPIFEIGFFLENGVLFAVYASPEEKLAEKVSGTDFVLAFDLTLTGAQAEQIVIDGTRPLTMPAARDNLLLGENTLKIHTQAEFDQVFNRGENTELPENLTIALSPIQRVELSSEESEGGDDNDDITHGAKGGFGDGPHNTFNGRPAYVLKNSIVVNNNVSIIGFNQEDTLVVKGHPDARIKIIGAEDAPVSGVNFSGWSFDGRGGVNDLGGDLISAENGGAIYLENAEQCQLECKIINHQTQLAGGGIYGREGVFEIMANHVRQNLANEGGGVFGCHLSKLTIYDCQALTRGGGVVGSNHSEIRVFNCDVIDCVDGILYCDNDDASFNGKLTFSGELNTQSMERITPFKIRGTGKNRDAPSHFILGNHTVYSTSNKKGIALTRLKRVDHSINGETTYHNTATEDGCNSLASVFLDEMSNDELGVLTSYDGIGTDHNEYLQSAFKKMGLYQALSLSQARIGSVPYAAIFEVNKNSPAGARVIESASSLQEDAYYAELSGWLIDGSVMASGGANNALIGADQAGGVLGAYVDHNGYVGIGTSSPVVPLTLQASENTTPVGITQNAYGGTSTMEFTTQDGNTNQATRICLRGGSDAANIEFLRGPKSFEAASMIINGTSGHVGIGTANPEYPLHVVGHADRQVGSYGYLNKRSPTGRTNFSQTVPYSICASSRIRAAEFNATSDARIKRITGQSDSQSDLELLLQLQVMDYQYIDHHAYGDAVKKGLIAQQVDTIFPQAVQQTEDFIPDIYSLSDRVSYNAETSELEVHLAQTVDLTAGDQVQLIAEKVGRIDKTVVAISHDRHSFTLGKWDQAVEKVFVYGKKVNDFRSIDYDRILMLCVSAARVQQERQQKLVQDNQALLAKIDRMETDYNELKAEFTNLKSMLLNDLNQG